ncbi:hypothetical protein ACF0H5_019545 [Mactra antiquata]
MLSWFIFSKFIHKGQFVGSSIIYNEGLSGLWKYYFLLRRINYYVEVAWRSLMYNCCLEKGSKMLQHSYFYSFLPSIYVEVLLIILICSYITSIHCDGTYNPPYKYHVHKGATVFNAKVDIHSLDSHQLYEDPVNMLAINWLNSTTNSISISWNLVEDYNQTGYVRDSVVEYFPKGGRFRSHPLYDGIREFTFNNLDAGTVYTICVYLTEVYGVENSSTIMHSRCIKINTIDYIRKDSVLIMLITLGYYAFMTLLGYTQWKRRWWAIRQKNKNRSKNEVANQMDSNCVIRWKDLAEREKLMNNSPGCSIESPAK